MAKITITEGLAEITLIEKKLERKRTFVLANLTRAKHIPDPFEKDGGAAKALAAELQSYNDLQNRLIQIRKAVAEANLANSVTLNDETRTISEWLTWKREVASTAKDFASAIARELKSKMDQAQSNPGAYKDETGAVKLVEYVFNAEYPEVVKKSELLHDTYEKLDGLLSLKNATIFIEI